MTTVTTTLPSICSGVNSSWKETKQTRRWDAAHRSGIRTVHKASERLDSRGNELKETRDQAVKRDPWLCLPPYRAIPADQVTLCICSHHGALFIADLGSNTPSLQYAYCLLLSASFLVIFRCNMCQTFVGGCKHQQDVTNNLDGVDNSPASFPCRKFCKGVKMEKSFNEVLLSFI